MNNIKKHIVFKTLTVFLSLSLLVPTGVKFAHIFAHHKHEVCLGEKFTHLHELNIDCDFHKFKLSAPYTFTPYNYTLFTPKEQTLEIVSQYEFISEYQRLQTALRGPPVLI